MHIEIIRRYYTEKTTISDLYIDGRLYCQTLEDKTRAPGEAKVWGQTAVPAGSYPCIVSYSPKFSQQMLEALDIPGFSKVRLHFGNKAEDTEGCWLVGKYNPKQPDWVSESRKVYAIVWALIWKSWVHKEPITVTVSDTKEFRKPEQAKVAKLKK